MPASDSAANATHQDERLPDELSEAGVYATTQEGFDHSLVVLALGYACWLMPFDTGYRLLVETSRVNRVHAELMRYDRECVGWPPPVAPGGPTMARLDFVTPLLWALTVLAVFRGQWLHPEWTDAGELDPAAMFDHGEVWRALTALFLHADSAHLGSNLFGGVFLFAAVLSVFGRVRGWLFIALPAVAGNLAVAAMHYPEPYRSLGASSAIFAALGLLTGRAVRVAGGRGHPHRWRTLFVPSAAGLTVLALYGAGGPLVDVLAHVTGFGAGLLLGLIATRTAALASK